MKNQLQQLAIFLIFSCISFDSFTQNAEWIYTPNSATLNPTTANVGIGTNANNEAKLSMQSATKYSMYLSNTGISETNPAYMIGTTYGIYTNNSTVSGTYSSNVYGLYSTNTLNSGSGGNGYGAYVSVNATAPITSKSIYGIYSTVSGAKVENSYSGYFTGGKLVVMNGNVGIGRTNPTVALDVNGIIRAQEIKLCLNQGCDYVFENDYKLMPLSELSTFVKTNKHLPEVAPAVEMESEGISVSEMNALLLKKNEELTLYIIDLEQRLSNVENTK
ncbi:MAG: hypothetical protein LBU90_03105 [Bacteroidales bacterium]|jgi:hypothetical protein|nr:hypothetical protein [Bacteroidales bacterium]